MHSLPIDAVALGTLGGRAASVLDSTMINITSPFLIKQVRYLLQLTGRTVGDDGPTAILICRGDATMAEVASAMQELNSGGPEDTTQTLTQDVIYTVYMNSVKIFQFSGLGTESMMSGDWFSPGGKNGMPVPEDTGFQAVVFNCGSGSLTTGSTVNGLIQVRGVWLRG